MNGSEKHHEGRKGTKNTKLIHRVSFAFVISLCFLLALPAVAQTPVTADAVNAVAKRLYCPVCENQPLDTCMTDACFQWRDEIRVQLEAGRTPDAIVADFVARFGERAIGTPLDPTLRALTLVTPFALAALALAVGVWTFVRWRGRTQGLPDARGSSVSANHAAPPPDADLIARIEQDLRR
jgi:cytochrome c-type biogenesis protein CcmH